MWPSSPFDSFDRPRDDLTVDQELAEIMPLSERIDGLAPRTIPRLSISTARARVPESKLLVRPPTLTIRRPSSGTNWARSNAAERETIVVHLAEIETVLEQEPLSPRSDSELPVRSYQPPATSCQRRAEPPSPLWPAGHLPHFVGDNVRERRWHLHPDRDYPRQREARPHEGSWKLSQPETAGPG